MGARGQQLCSPTTVDLTLENMIQALVKGNKTEQKIFGEALQNLSNVALMDGVSLDTIGNNSSFDQLAAFNERLKADGVYFTMADLIQLLHFADFADVTQVCAELVCRGDPDSPLAVAINEAQLPCRQKLGDAELSKAGDAINGNGTGLTVLLNALLNIDTGIPMLNVGLKDWILRNLIPWLKANVQFQIICDSRFPQGLSAKVNFQLQIVITYNLYPIVPCGPGGGGDMQKDDVVEYFKCGEGNNPTFITAPFLADAGGMTNAAVFQLIIDKLSNLERCCPPCPGVEKLLLTAIQGVGNATLPGDGTATWFQTILFEITQEVAQGAANFSNPPRWKYGSFTWVYHDGTHSQPMFVNYDNHRFYVPKPENPAVGIAWHLEPGIVANVYGPPTNLWLGGSVYP
jgi:hypothetical protein